MDVFNGFKTLSRDDLSKTFNIVMAFSKCQAWSTTPRTYRRQHEALLPISSTGNPLTAMNSPLLDSGTKPHHRFTMTA
jgi:hypothetical protein